MLSMCGDGQNMEVGDECFRSSELMWKGHSYVSMSGHLHILYTLHDAAAYGLDISGESSTAGRGEILQARISISPLNHVYS